MASKSKEITTAKKPAPAKSTTPAKAAEKKAGVSTLAKTTVTALKTAKQTPDKSKSAKETPAAKKTVPKATATAEKSKTSKPAKSKDAPATQEQPKTPSPVETTQPDKQHKWSDIRSQLLQMKTATLNEIARSIKKGSETNLREEPTGDIYDQASSERDRELGLILNDREREKLHSIDDALLRMDEGEYGICEECDEDIPTGRLKAMPFTRHCVKCKSDLEKLQAQTRRFEEERAYREMPVGEDEEG